MNTPRLMIAVLLVAGTPALLRAQAPADPLDTLRTQAQLSDEDRNRIRTFVNDRLPGITGADERAAQEAVRELRAAYSGNDEFKRAYAAVCIDLFGPVVQQAELRPAVRALSLLTTFDTLAARPLFVRALTAEAVGVRAAAAVGLRTLRPRIAAGGGEEYLGTVAALKQAGLKERSRDTLRTIYGALDYSEVPNRPDLKPAATALIEVLDERARQYRAVDDPPALGADDAGLLAVEHLRGALSDDERQRLTIAAAVMVRRAITAYVTPPRKLMDVRDETTSAQALETRNAMERLVQAGERLLAVLLGQDRPPDVVGAMRSLDSAGMRLQWEQWTKLLSDRVNQDFALPAETEPEAETPAAP